MAGRSLHSSYGSSIQTSQDNIVKVLHISSFAFTGGAARAAYRLHDGLTRANIDSSMIVSPMEKSDGAVVSFEVTNSLYRMARRYIRGLRIQRSLNRYRHNRPESLELFSSDRSRYGAELVKSLPPHDVVHLHWISGFVDLATFFRFQPPNKTIVWTLHDMNTFSGGCHYGLECSRYKHGCGQCPQLGSDDPHDLSDQIWKRKQCIFLNIKPENLHLVTPSNWLANEVRQSPLLKRFPLSIIPYGIDTGEFSPRSKEASRAALGIHPNTNVILFIAHNVRIKRKGLKLLYEALQRIPNINNYCLLSIGRGIPFKDLGFQHIHLGTIENDRLLSAVISAASLFVIPSQQDNLPNTVLEAMACGTPVLGFKTGGIPDMVREGVTGQLVENGDVGGLSEHLVRMLEDPGHLAELSANCRRIAIEKYDLHSSAQKYIELYQEVCCR